MLLHQKDNDNKRDLCALPGLGRSLWLPRPRSATLLHSLFQQVDKQAIRVIMKLMKWMVVIKIWWKWNWRWWQFWDRQSYPQMWSDYVVKEVIIVIKIGCIVCELFLQSIFLFQLKFYTTPIDLQPRRWKSKLNQFSFDDIDLMLVIGIAKVMMMR